MKKLPITLAILFLTFLALESQSQMLPTKLQVTVTNDLGNLVEGATVTLYKTQDDYDNSENPVQAGTSDAKGRVQFKELAPMSYFMDARKDDMTNIGRGVKTTKLISKKKNMLNVVIE